MKADEWEFSQLGDVATLQRGFDLPSSQRKTGNYPVVSSGGILGTHAQYKVRGPGVVTGRYGSIGEVFFIQKEENLLDPPHPNLLPQGGEETKSSFFPPRPHGERGLG